MNTSARKGELVEQVGRCKRCGRSLKSRFALSAGYGRDCAARAGVPWGRPRRRLEQNLRALESETGDAPLFPEVDRLEVEQLKKELTP